MLKSSYSRGKALAALLDLCGDRESDFIVQIFFDVLSGSDSEQRAFIRELERRKPKEWKITFRKIVDHSGFEHLDNLTVVYFAHLTAQLGKTSIPTYKDNRNLPIPDVRKRLRAYFGLPEVR